MDISQPIISLHHIQFREKKFLLLKDICFDVYFKEILALVGTNGAGKSTALKVCANTLTPSQGEIRSQINHYGLEVGFLPDKAPTLVDWDVLTYLKYICQMRKIKFPKKAIDRVIDLCRLSGILQKTIKTLSKGNCQRVGLAQAIIHHPKLILLDEPTAGLDPRQINQFRQILIELKQEAAIIFSSHIMQEISQLCNRAIILDQGQTIDEINIDQRKNLTTIEFYEQIPDYYFSNYKCWISTENKTHYFSFNSPREKQLIISYCMEKNFQINTISSGSEVLENQFITILNNHENHY